MKKLFLFCIALITVPFAGHTQWTNDGITQNTLFGNEAVRTGATGVGFTDATDYLNSAGASGARFLVKGGILGHVITNPVGSFSAKWCGLGEGNPGNFPGVPNPYGLSIADNNNVGFFNLFPRPNTTITRDLVVGFGEAGANTNTNRFILRSYFGPSASIQKDLLITNPSGATGINAEPQSTFWVDAVEDASNLQKAIAIVDKQVFGPPANQNGQLASSGIGRQANNSLITNGIVVEGFRAQVPDFFTTVTQIPNTEGVGVNLQAVKSPYGGPNISAATDVVSVFNVNGTSEYAELTWQDLDNPFQLSSTQCDPPFATLQQVEAWDKFFISFRNRDNVNPFGQGQKLPVMAFQGNGRVGIGTLQPTSGSGCDNGIISRPILLDVNGQILSGGSLVSSDRRFKQDIQPIDDAMKMVRQLQGTTYTYRKAEFPDRNFAGGNQYGFIAQDVEKVMPEAAFENSDGYYVMNYTVLIPLLTEAIKEQDAVAAQQQVRLTALEQELAELRSQFNDLKAGQQPGDLQGYRLEQNTPNPFGQSTVIGYSIPANVNNAMIRVYDLTGRMLRSFTLAAGEGTVTIQAGELSDGLYIYDLSVGGRQILERKMSVVRN